MNIFSRKPVAEPEITGTTILREVLKNRARKRSFSAFAHDINDAIAQDASRKTARTVALRMVGSDADEAVIASIAKGLIGTLPEDTSVPRTNPDQLEAFAEGKADLVVEVKQHLTKQLYPHSAFDPVSGMLTTANREPARSFVHPPRFDPKSAPYYFPHDPNAPRIGPQPVIPVPPQPKGPRPGWI